MRVGTMVRERHGRTELVCKRAWYAQSAWDRMRGLLGRPALAPGEGLLIDPCASVHTIGMRYPLDIVFMTEDGIAMKLVRHLAPLRMAFGWGAGCTLELAAGEIDRLAIAVGDEIFWKD